MRAPGGDTATIRRACTRDQYETVRALRNRLYHQRLGYMPDTPLEIVRDHVGYLFILDVNGTPVATGRALPFGSGLTEIRSGTDVPLAGGHDLCEIARFAAVPGTVGSVPSSLACLMAGALWLIENTSLLRYAAWCRDALVGLYQSVGASVVGSVTRQVGQRPVELHLLLGDIAPVAELARQSGIANLVGRSSLPRVLLESA